VTSSNLTSSPQERRSRLLEGLRFGLLLQLAIGPVCMFVLRTGAEHGFLSGLLAVTAVVVVDAAYITLAGLGVTQWSNDRRVRTVLKWAGVFVIGGFGMDMVLAAHGVHLIPAGGVPHQGAPTANPFVAGFFLTAASPLTIIFWAGVFSAKVAEQRFSRRDVWLFSLGCLLATVSFMLVVSAAGALVGTFLSARSISILDTIVGCTLVYFAIRLAAGKTPNQESEDI
jgi:threonine/homoserine/homoserine lactone efflux protein